MTITISKNELLSKLTSISKIISGKPVFPIMDYILFESKDGKLNLSAADASGRIDTSTDNVTIEGDINICLDAKLLIDALKTLPEQPVTFTINPQNFCTIIKYSGGKFELMGKETSTFPASTQIKEPIEVSIPADILINGINKTIGFAASDDLRPVMNGVFTESDGDKLCFVASDGHALALRETQLKTQQFALNIPQRIAGILTKIIPFSEDYNVNVKIGQNKASFSIDETTITAILVEGRYPNYRSVIPTKNDKSVKVNSSLFRGALSRTMIFSGHTGLIKIDLSKDTILLAGQDIDFSTSADEKLSCDYAGAPIQIGFNGNILQKIISLIDSDEATLTLSDPNRAGLIYPFENESDSRLLYLIMPLVINN
jgi:DNA polymerase-3 subunit beta